MPTLQIVTALKNLIFIGVRVANPTLKGWGLWGTTHSNSSFFAPSSILASSINSIYMN
jgi:hypothetical protein